MNPLSVLPSENDEKRTTRFVILPEAGSPEALVPDRTDLRSVLTFRRSCLRQDDSGCPWQDDNGCLRRAGSSLRALLAKARAVIVFLLVAGMLGVGGCSAPASNAQGGLGNGWKPESSMALAYAQKFGVDYYRDGLALISIQSGTDTDRYLVVPEGGSVPSGIAADITVLRQPLTNLYVAASATMSLFAALDSLSAVRFSSVQADSWYVPAAKQAMESGQIVYGGKYSTPDYELILQAKPGLTVENGMIYHSPEVKEKLESLGIPVLVEQSSYESHPLGRTEWIKVFGVLMGKEEAAERIFDQQRAQLDALAGQADTGKTVAFFYISSAGYVVTRKSGDYIPAIIRLAGGEYIFSNLGDAGATSTVNLEMEQFYAQARQADFIIYNSTVGGDLASIADLLALSPLLADFTAVQTGQVWSTDKDFYQDMTGLGTMITDIHEMLTKGDSAPDQLNFLHRLH